MVGFCAANLGLFAQSGMVFNHAEWKEILAEAKKENKIVFVDAYTTWCGPCKMIAPILEELAKEYDGQIYIYKIDTEQEQELAGAFGIRSIPTLLFVPMEGKPQMAQGAMPKQGFKDAIEDVLLGKKK